MIFANSFWSKPLLNNKFDTFENSLFINMFSFTMSAEMVRAFGHDIVLYTDNYGKELLSIAPYSDIVVLDIPEDASEHFAAQIKFEALKRMELGQIHIDGDIFLWKQGIYDIIERADDDILYAAYEINNYLTEKDPLYWKYDKMLKKLSVINYEQPYRLPSMNEINWPNTSIIKINSQELKDDYISQYEHHKAKLQGIDFENTWPDIIIEQYFLELLCKSKNYTTKEALENFRGNEQKAIDLGLMHLGTSKRQKIYLAVDWIKKHDPARFNTIINIINKQRELHN